MTDAAGARRILVVDDSESNRYVLATWLRRAGHDVIEASTGTQALHVADTEPIDLVVLDINLPDMTGYEVCEQIKGAAATHSLPVLHVSATAIAPADRSEGLRRGADGYLVEPVERQELLASVQALLRGAEAQRTAIRLAFRLRGLNDATLAINQAATVEQLLRTIADEAAMLFEQNAVVALTSDDRATIVVARTDAQALVTASSPAAVDALRRASLEAAPAAARLLAAYLPVAGDTSFLAVDLTDPGSQRGCLFIELPEPARQRAIADETEVVVKQFARAAATALRNMRTYDIERQIALTLQRHLLPDIAPAIPGLDVAVRYKASAEHADVGGDFYEIFELGDDRVAVAIGDVVGHSLEAAAVMAQLRTGVRSYMLEGHGPTATLNRLNRLLLRFHPGVTATVCCAVYDRATGRCELANAGHPPPLIARAGRAEFLPEGGPLLGVEVPAREAHTFVLEPGSVLFLFTDGLIERRGETIDDGLLRLANSVPAETGDLGGFCDRILRDAGPVDVLDDIALVAFRSTG